MLQGIRESITNVFKNNKQKLPEIAFEEILIMMGYCLFAPLAHLRMLFDLSGFVIS